MGHYLALQVVILKNSSNFGRISNSPIALHFLMTDSQILAKQLSALIWRKEIGAEDLRELLVPFSRRKKLAPASFSNAINSRLSPQGEVFRDLKDALAAFAKSEKIDLAQIVREHASDTSKLSLGGDRIFSRLKGAWFLCQYRGKREKPKDEPAAADLRLAVLIFGTVTETASVTMQIIGESTNWHGEVRSHSHDKLLYFTAAERERVGIEERIDMITHHPSSTEGKVSFQAGIILGIGRGDHNGSTVPIYSSKVILWKIQTHTEKSLIAPIESEAEILRLKKYCGYLNETEVADLLRETITDPILVDQKNAIKYFLLRSVSNHGDRLFVES